MRMEVSKNYENFPSLTLYTYDYSCRDVRHSHSALRGSVRISKESTNIKLSNIFKGKKEGNRWRSQRTCESSNLRCVDVLSACSAAAVYVNADIPIIDFHLFLLCLRQYSHRHRARVNSSIGWGQISTKTQNITFPILNIWPRALPTPLTLCCRHPLHSVYSALVFKKAVDTVAAHHTHALPRAPNLG